MRCSLRHASVVALLAATGLGVFALADSPPAPRAEPPPPAPRAPGRAPEAAPPQARWDAPTIRLDATMYRVTLPVSSVAQLDAAALGARAGNLADFGKALEAIGPVTLMYRVDQALDAASPARIDVSSNLPYAVAGGGAPTTAISRNNAGLSLEWSSRVVEAGPPVRAEVALEIEVSFQSEMQLDAAGGMRAPVFRRISQRYTTPFVLGKPAVLIAAETAAAESGRLEAIVTRVVMHSVAD